MRFQESLKKNIFWAVLFCIALLCMWKTQRTVPVMMDDEWYSTVLCDSAPLTSVHDIFRAQVWHYQNWGGRTVAHTILQFILLYLSEPLADALNILLILFLAWLTGSVSGEKRFSFLTLTVGFLHGLNANWKMSMYWQTGACNYLYTTVIILLFLHPYLRRSDGTEPKNIPLLTILMAPLGLLAGWTNENMGPAIWLMSLGAILLLRQKKQPVKPWMWIGNICCLAGSALLILAPGNSVRTTQVISSEYGTLWRIFLQVYAVCKGAWDFLFPTILIAVFLILINVFVLKSPLQNKEILLLGGSLLSWGAMILSPHYPDRAAFGTMVLLLCVILSQAGTLLKTVKSKPCAVMLAGVGVFVWLRGMYYMGEFLAIYWGWIR